MSLTQGAQVLRGRAVGTPQLAVQAHTRTVGAAQYHLVNVL